jgi:phosphopantothenoylcysteine decarboxylase/phosphopantothenate--cysteine ligase
MAAAVADYSPRDGQAAEKIEKGEGDLNLILRRTPDILRDLGRRRGSNPRPVLVGFAAETSNVLERAREKLEAKQLDVIVANDVSRADAGFGVATNAATIVERDGGNVEDVPLGTKQALARVILAHLARLLSASVEAPAGDRP